MSKTEILTIRIDENQKQELVKLAILDKRSLSNYCEVIFDEHIKREKDRVMNSKNPLIKNKLI
jgi:hypothetical protein